MDPQFDLINTDTGFHVTAIAEWDTSPCNGLSDVTTLAHKFNDKWSVSPPSECDTYPTLKRKVFCDKIFKVFCTDLSLTLFWLGTF